MGQLKVNKIIVDIEKKKIKNMYLRILSPDGRIKISAPQNMPEETIRNFVISKMDWINRKQNKIKSRHMQQEFWENQDYTTGTVLYLWGDIYTLEIIYSSKVNNVVPKGDILVVEIKKSECKCSVDHRKSIIKEWYRSVLAKKVSALADKWEKIIGISALEWRIKDMKTRWGSCNIGDRRIWINLNLAMKSPVCLEYVIVHELVHLMEKNHNYVFKAYMDRYLPGWRAIKARLNS